MCDCSEDIKSIKETQASLAFSVMLISQALQALCDEKAASKRLEERSRALKDDMPNLRRIVHSSGVDPHDEDTKPDHPIPRRDRDTVPSPSADHDNHGAEQDR